MLQPSEPDNLGGLSIGGLRLESHTEKEVYFFGTVTVVVAVDTLPEWSLLWTVMV